MVLGAGGFIGRQLSEALATAGCTVIAATRRPATFQHPSIVNVVASYEEAADFAAPLASCFAVVHAASSSTPGSSEARPQLDGNLRATLALIEALQVRTDLRLLYLSTGGALYGDHRRAVSEDAPLRPRSYHGAGKAAAELFLNAWAEQYGGSAVVLRPSNVYGPGQSRRQGFGIVPAAFNATRLREALPIWGDGSTVRDFLYIDDLLDLCGRVLTGEWLPGLRRYNAAYGRGTSLNELLDRVDAATGHRILRDYRPPRRVDLASVVPDSSAALAAYGWAPRVPLEQGLASTWAWYQSHAE